MHYFTPCIPQPIGLGIDYVEINIYSRTHARSPCYFTGLQWGRSYWDVFHGLMQKQNPVGQAS